jgi:hypothetical protein
MDTPIDRVISALNSIRVGDLDRIDALLGDVRGTLLGLDEPELIERVDEARQAIARGDVPLFRKRIQLIVSRLGHRR